MSNSEVVQIVLTKKEALVLFDFLGRFNEKENKDLFEDQAEQRVLWDIEAVLEKNLAEPFRKDYLDLLAKARAEVRDEIEE